MQSIEQYIDSTETGNSIKIHTSRVVFRLEQLLRCPVVKCIAREYVFRGILQDMKQNISYAQMPQICLMKCSLILVRLRVETADPSRKSSCWSQLHCKASRVTNAGSKRIAWKRKLGTGILPAFLPIFGGSSAVHFQAPSPF